MGKATTPVDCDQLEKEFPALFSAWDRDQDGSVGYGDMMGAGGLFCFAQDRFRATAAARCVPDIKDDRAAWFRYWDEDASGSLDREEVLRSLTKTFGLSSDPSQIAELRDILAILWVDFDADGSGCIEMEEFCRPHGLAEVVMANLRL